jgi:hypothetical protein
MTLGLEELDEFLLALAMQRLTVDVVSQSSTTLASIVHLSARERQASSSNSHHQQLHADDKQQDCSW